MEYFDRRELKRLEKVKKVHDFIQDIYSDLVSVGDIFYREKPQKQYSVVIKIEQDFIELLTIDTGSIGFIDHETFFQYNRKLSHDDYFKMRGEYE